jgi:hypothetical protein
MCLLKLPVLFSALSFMPHAPHTSYGCLLNGSLLVVECLNGALTVACTGNRHSNFVMSKVFIKTA